MTLNQCVLLFSFSHATKVECDFVLGFAAQIESHHDGQVSDKIDGNLLVVSTA